MTKIVFGMSAAVLLIGCDVFVSPKVRCDEYSLSALTQPDRPITITLSQTNVAAGMRCVFPELSFTVSHSPRIDVVDPGSPTKPPNQTDLSLVGGKVFVAQADSSVLLCPGVGEPCTPDTGGAAAITVVIDKFGALSYRGTTAGVVLQEGGSYTATGVLVTENYGPGNTCPVYEDFSFTCIAPVK